MKKIFPPAILALFLLGWCSFAIAPAAFAQSNIVGGGMYGDVKASSGGGCSQATTLNAKLDGGQNTSAVTTAVCGMVTDGDWAKLDFLYVFAINSSGNALLNWVSTSFNGTVGGTGCTFTANAGYNNSNSSCFISTGYIPSSSGGNATLNSATVSACQETSNTITAEGFYLGAGDASNSTLLGPFYGGITPTFADINDANFTSAGTPTNAQGSWILSRTSSSATTLYRNGTSFSTPGGTSGALVTVQLYVMARNNNGTADSFTPAGSIFGYAFGGSGSINAANIRARLNTYMTAVGASGC
jgi:hypothetical protein